MVNNPSKRYMLLGTNMIMKQMRVLEVIKRQSSALYEEVMGIASDVFNTLLGRAVKLQRNYILDQANVILSTRTQKLQSFVQTGFRARAAVFVLADEDLFPRQRNQMSAENKFVPDEVIANLKAHFTLPTPAEGFLDILWVEQKLPAALAIVAQQRGCGQAWLAAAQQSRKRALDSAPASAPQSINSGSRPALQRPRMDGPQPSSAANGQPAGAGQPGFFQAAPPDASRPLLSAPVLSKPQVGGMAAGPMTLFSPGQMMAGNGAQGAQRSSTFPQPGMPGAPPILQMPGSFSNLQAGSLSLGATQQPLQQQQQQPLRQQQQQQGLMGASGMPNPVKPDPAASFRPTTSQAGSGLPAGLLSPPIPPVRQQQSLANGLQPLQQLPQPHQQGPGMQGMQQQQQAPHPLGVNHQPGQQLVAGLQPPMLSGQSLMGQAAPAGLMSMAAMGPNQQQQQTVAQQTMLQGQMQSQLQHQQLQSQGFSLPGGFPHTGTGRLGPTQPGANTSLLPGGAMQQGKGGGLPGNPAGSTHNTAPGSMLGGAPSFKAGGAPPSYLGGGPAQAYDVPGTSSSNLPNPSTTGAAPVQAMVYPGPPVLPGPPPQQRAQTFGSGSGSSQPLNTMGRRDAPDAPAAAQPQLLPPQKPEQLAGMQQQQQQGAWQPQDAGVKLPFPQPPQQPQQQGAPSGAQRQNEAGRVKSEAVEAPSQQQLGGDGQGPTSHAAARGGSTSSMGTRTRQPFTTTAPTPRAPQLTAVAPWQQAHLRPSDRLRPTLVQTRPPPLQGSAPPTGTPPEAPHL
ncbi:MAG: hypothetical protein WDW36_001296 [Sanguina aurantia]